MKKWVYYKDGNVAYFELDGLPKETQSIWKDETVEFELTSSEGYTESFRTSISELKEIIKAWDERNVD